MRFQTLVEAAEVAAAEVEAVQLLGDDLLLRILRMAAAAEAEVVEYFLAALLFV